jgi:hypothetical protein
MPHFNSKFVSLFPKIIQQKSRKFSMIKVKGDLIMKKMTEHQIVVI